MSHAFLCIPGLKKACTVGKQKCVLSMMAWSRQLSSPWIANLSLENNSPAFEELYVYWKRHTDR